MNQMISIANLYKKIISHMDVLSWTSWIVLHKPHIQLEYRDQSIEFFKYFSWY